MKISAGLIVRNEADRFLGLALQNLLEWVDDIAVVDDGSTDDWEDLIPLGAPVRVLKLDQTGRDCEPAFYRHAVGRNRLLELTLEGYPEWIVATDADEMITDGATIRQACERATTDVLTVQIAECWKACDQCLCTREDGGWRTHPIGAVWRADRFRKQALRLADKDTATGRVPDAVHRVKDAPTGSSLIHFGWVNEAERLERYKRHVGSAHARQHVDSILWGDDRVTLKEMAWPAGWDAGTRAALIERANRE